MVSMSAIGGTVISLDEDTKVYGTYSVSVSESKSSKFEVLYSLICSPGPS